jgi:hypothetical protein
VTHAVSDGEALCAFEQTVLEFLAVRNGDENVPATHSTELSHGVREDRVWKMLEDLRANDDVEAARPERQVLDIAEHQSERRTTSHRMRQVNADKFEPSSEVFGGAEISKPYFKATCRIGRDECNGLRQAVRLTGRKL